MPEGLPAGSVVRVVAFDHDYRVVEWQGKQFRIFMMNLQPGLEKIRMTRRRAQFLIFMMNLQGKCG